MNANAPQWVGVVVLMVLAAKWQNSVMHTLARPTCNVVDANQRVVISVFQTSYAADIGQLAPKLFSRL